MSIIIWAILHYKQAYVLSITTDIKLSKIITYSDQNEHIILAILHYKQAYVLSITTDMELSKIITYSDQNGHIIWALLHYKQAYILSITRETTDFLDLDCNKWHWYLTRNCGQVLQGIPTAKKRQHHFLRLANALGS